MTVAVANTTSQTVQVSGCSQPLVTENVRSVIPHLQTRKRNCCKPRCFEIPVTSSVWKVDAAALRACFKCSPGSRDMLSTKKFLSLSVTGLDVLGTHLERSRCEVRDVVCALQLTEVHRYDPSSHSRLTTFPRNIQVDSTAAKACKVSLTSSRFSIPASRPFILVLARGQNLKLAW